MKWTDPPCFYSRFWSRMPPRKKIPVEAQSPPPEMGEIEPVPEVPAPAPTPKKKYDMSPAVVEARKRAGLAAKEKRAAEAEAREEERRIARETIEILREMKAEKERKKAKPIVVNVPEQKATPPPPEAPSAASGAHNVPPRMLEEAQKAPRTDASEGVEAPGRSLLFSDDDDAPARPSRFARRTPRRR